MNWPMNVSRSIMHGILLIDSEDRPATGEVHRTRTDCCSRTKCALLRGKPSPLLWNFPREWVAYHCVKIEVIVWQLCLPLPAF